MRYAIVINLDYESYFVDDCKFVWERIRQEMENSGFRMDKRLFTIDSSEEAACDTARTVIERLNRSPKLQGIDVYSYMKDFYGYDHSNAVNLMLPSTKNIVVELR